MLFWQPQLFFWQKADDLSQNVRKWWFFSHNDEILQNFRIDSENSVLTTGPKNFWHKATKLSLNAENHKALFKKLFSSKRFWWTGRILFWQPQLFFLTRGRRLVAQCFESDELFSHNIELLLNFRIDNENSVLTAGPIKYSTQSHNFFVECGKCSYFV